MWLVGFVEKDKEKKCNSKTGSPSGASPNSSNADVKGQFLSVPGIFNLKCFLKCQKQKNSLSCIVSVIKSIFLSFALYISRKKIFLYSSSVN